MKKFIVAILFTLSLFGGYVDDLKQYLLEKSFRINGTFYLVQDEGKSIWVFASLNSNGQFNGLYELMGERPSPQNPFGWKRIDHAIDMVHAKTMGYFIYIDFPKDEGRSRLYSWIFVDIQGRMYKLADQKNGYFHYLDIDKDGTPDAISDLYFHKESNEAHFYNCRSSLEEGYTKIEKYSKSTGDVGYMCEIAKDEPFVVKRPLEVKGIHIEEKITGNLMGKAIRMHIARELSKGTAHIEADFGDKNIICDKRYKPLKSLKITTSHALGIALEWQSVSKEMNGTCEVNQSFLAKTMDIEYKKTITIQENNGSAQIEIFKRLFGSINPF